MERNFIILTLALLLSFTQTTKAQLGFGCVHPDTILSLPYVRTGLTTASSGDAFDTTSACNSQYMTGNDYAFLFTPPYDMYININITNIGILRYTGVFLIKSCPGNISSVCVAMDSSTLVRTPSLVNIPVLGGSEYYIVVSTQSRISGININTTTPFDISVIQGNPYDLEMKSVIGPAGGCYNSSTDTVVVVIRNTGVLAVDTFRAGFSVDGGPAVTELVNTRILPNDTLVYQFIQTADLSVAGLHTITAFTAYLFDDYNANDTASATIMHDLNINTYPYYEDFEAGNNGYWTAGGTNSSWACGTPTAPIINAAASGSNAWVTNLAGYHNAMEDSYVYSPCFDFSNINNPIIELDIWKELALQGVPFSFTTSDVQASLDGGLTWTVIGATGDPVNWYNSATIVGWAGNTGQWIHATHRLTGLGAQNNVRIRIHLNGTLAMAGTETEGFAFDNIFIYDGPSSDMGISEIITPVSGCNLGGSEMVTVKLKNFGSNPQTNFPVAYSVNGGPFHVESVPATVLPGDSTNYTFSQRADLSSFGNYLIKATTCLYTDTIHRNDTAVINISHSQTVATFPYQEGFENGHGGWNAGGVNSSWAMGYPACIVITAPASGNFCWKTNLTGNYNASENSYVESPCFDLSPLSVPVIEMSIENETALSGAPFGFAHAFLLATINNGQTWDTIGRTGDTLNWYRGLLGGWSASSGQWLRAKHNLSQVAGQTNVKFRVAFGATIPFPGMETEGFAFDSVMIRDCPPVTAAFTTNVNEYLLTTVNTSVGGTRYNWRFGDGTTGNTFEPDHSYAQNGDYNVTLIAGNGCRLDSVTHTIHVESHLGIGNGKHLVSCYPNPGKGVITITYNSSDFNGPLFTLYDPLGKELWIEQQPATMGIVKKTVDFSSLGKGIYLLHVTEKETKSIIRVVIN